MRRPRTLIDEGRVTPLCRAVRLRAVLTTFASVLLLDCTIYDESLLVGNGGAKGADGQAEGGASSAAAGSSRSFGAGGALSSGSGGASTTVECSGVSVNGICWHFGKNGESCVQACADHGGHDPAATAWIGTATQGGSLENCTAILAALNVSPAPIVGFRTDGVGLGCMSYLPTGVTFWHAAPEFDPAAQMADSRLACGCKK
jgi:hypothetical protein